MAGSTQPNTASASASASQPSAKVQANIKIFEHLDGRLAQVRTIAAMQVGPRAQAAEKQMLEVDNKMKLAKEACARAGKIPGDQSNPQGLSHAQLEQASASACMLRTNSPRSSMQVRPKTILIFELPAQTSDDRKDATAETSKGQFESVGAHLAAIQQSVIDDIREPNELSQALQRHFHKTIKSLKVAKDDCNSMGLAARAETLAQLDELQKQGAQAAESRDTLRENLTLLGTLMKDFDNAGGRGVHSADTHTDNLDIQC
ncbi:uncharacterized protein MYCGRDRAFT_89903 [Zymoseptoria tritici IPO323]|uniref:Uncharacterized protein n=1 Tax=Zymoseptoria tritici (strain CBS 115943 / IPO323) TaxID=336722 RepID=F9WWU9_ZYMTI|nr:uncharacterized protein MYCGRDRAFT_89903 [Zymoseptoria tritici IPO323]EGP92060.1 hypothetical protein MYCGRDRAFT_89903 [Zymoseptoria tritici IPO323]